MALLLRFITYNSIRQLVSQLPDDSFNDAKRIFEETITEAYDAMDKRLSGKALKQRSGDLRSTLKKRVSGTGLSNLRASLSVGGYSRIHEFGATISAKNKYLWLRGGPYMNYPTAVNYGSNGKPKMDARTIFSSGGKVKYGNNGFGLYLGGVKMMNLAKKVKIPARLGFRDTTTAFVPILFDRLNNELLAGTAKKNP